MKRLDLISKRLRERNEARAYIKNVDEAMLEYYRVFVKKIRPSLPEPELFDFYHPSENKKNGELLFVVVGTGIATYCLWAGGKAIKELHKITSTSKKEIKSWLAKQALWQVQIPPPKEIHHPHYDVTRPNEQHQFDFLYMLHNLFEANTYKYILTGINVASRYKVARPQRTKKSSKVAFVLEAIYKKGGVFKYPKTFQCDNGSEFEIEVA